MNLPPPNQMFDWTSELELNQNQVDIHTRSIAARFLQLPEALLNLMQKCRDSERLMSYPFYHDILTGLPNRTLFRDRLNLSLIQALRNNNQLAVLVVDLDRFKMVNDMMGHLKGDELLQQVAKRLLERLREVDILARLDRDVFIILAPDLHDKWDAAGIAEQLALSLLRPFYIGKTQLHMTASIGIAMFPEDGASVDDLIRQAETAMYLVKARGKNGHQFFERSPADPSLHRIVLEQSLRRALDCGELEMYYQPQINVETGRVVGAESLIRWNHPEFGVLNAADFMSIVEEHGLILPVSEWMLEPLCRDVREWNSVSDQRIRLSFNLSPHYLERGDFTLKLNEAMQRHAIDAAQLEVEITENLCILDPRYAREQLDKLCNLGVSIAIDDFGTGYSSLAYLHRFPVNTIKIDQSFVSEIQSVCAHYPVVMAIISIAHGLGLKLVAEGVETAIQASYLANAGCGTMQGFLYHKAMPQREFLQLLRNQNQTGEGL